MAKTIPYSAKTIRIERVRKLMGFSRMLQDKG
jgi:hypothetical protein